MSNFERARLDEMITTYQAKATANTVTNLIGSVSFPMLGIAALIWVGFSLDDFIEDTKSWAKRQGNKLASWIESNGLINYTADEIGRAITETENKKAALYAESMEFYQAGEGNYSSAKGKRYRADLTALEEREEVLRKMLNDIATGNTDSLYKAGWLFQQTEGDKEKTADFLQSWYQQEGGEGDINWEISDSEGA